MEQKHYRCLDLKMQPATKSGSTQPIPLAADYIPADGTRLPQKVT